MKKLFIIGNGFDISHGIPSTYNDFKEYLKTTYCISDDPYPVVSSSDGHHGEIIIDPYESAKLLVYGINTTDDYVKWSEFENDLANMDFSWLAPSIDDYADKDGVTNPYYFENIFTPYLNDFLYNIAMWRKLFEEWVEEVNNDIIDTYSPYKANDKVLKLLDSESFVLSFNYTKTIESIYNFYNILHIHNKVGEDLIWGHGKDKHSVDNSYDFDAEQLNIMVINIYKKEVDKQIEKHKSFFDSLKGLKLDIYSFGFDYSDVDLPYIKQIINNISVESKWFLNNFGDCFYKQKNVIESLGFKGKIINWNGNYYP